MKRIVILAMLGGLGFVSQVTPNFSSFKKCIIIKLLSNKSKPSKKCTQCRFSDSCEWNQKELTSKFNDFYFSTLYCENKSKEVWFKLFAQHYPYCTDEYGKTLFDYVSEAAQLHRDLIHAQKNDAQYGKHNILSQEISRNRLQFFEEIKKLKLDD